MARFGSLAARACSDGVFRPRGPHQADSLKSPLSRVKGDHLIGGRDRLAGGLKRGMGNGFWTASGRVE